MLIIRPYKDAQFRQKIIKSILRSRQRTLKIIPYRAARPPLRPDKGILPPPSGGFKVLLLCYYYFLRFTIVRGFIS